MDNAKIVKAQKKFLPKNFPNFKAEFKVNTLVYYGLSYNVDSLAGDLYVNNVINGAVELLAYI